MNAPPRPPGRSRRPGAATARPPARPATPGALAETGRPAAARRRALSSAATERQRLHDVLMEAPAAIAIVRGPGHVYEMANPQYLRLLGHSGVLGRPVREAVPERPEAAVLAGSIVASAGELAGMVDDLLDFACIERGPLTVNPADVDLVPILRGAIAGLGERAGAERVVADLPVALPAHADPKRVAQAVDHLLVNALTYAPDGPITLRAGPAPGATGAVRVEVEDSGPGIPAAEQGRLWEKFYRGPTRLTGPTRGAGIGLAVVKAIIEAQSGHVGLASAPGAGNRFWLELPVAHAPYGSATASRGGPRGARRATV